MYRPKIFKKYLIQMSEIDKYKYPMPFRLVRLIIIALKFIFFPKLVHLFQVTLHNCISKFNINGVEI